MVRSERDGRRVRQICRISVHNVGVDVAESGVAQLDQIQISFVPDEDRLLLRLSTQEQEEFRLWLTRRLVRALRPALDQTLAAQPRIQTQATVQARQELLKFEHERVVQSADFKTPYRAEEKRLPLGQQPLVVTQIKIQRRPDGGVALSLAPTNGQGLDLALTPPLLHSFVALLEHALAKADWALEQTIVAAAAPEGGSLSVN